jgi:hypothetical protein
MVFARSVLALVVVFASPSNGWHEFRPSRPFDPAGYGGWPHNTPAWCGSELILPPEAYPLFQHRRESLETVVRSFGPRAKAREHRSDGRNLRLPEHRPESSR